MDGVCFVGLKFSLMFVTFVVLGFFFCRCFLVILVAASLGQIHAGSVKRCVLQSCCTDATLDTDIVNLK